MKERTGLVIVYTGDGKGKTTAALGLVVRALGAGMRAAVVQFIKSQPSGEHRALAELSGGRVEILLCGTGFVRSDGPPPPEAVAAAKRALELARQRVQGGTCDLVVLDESLPAVAAGLLAEGDLLALLDSRSAAVHVVLTGRGATAAVIDRADVVTEMRCVKHAFDRGRTAQPGIEM
jgi:cob(I)alamin adenosyltransferase